MSKRHEIFINPVSDFGFKKLFGREANKDLLMDFLNTLLPEAHQIADLTFQNTERLGGDPEAQRQNKLTYDILCRNAQGEQFIVEMQNGLQSYFVNRAIYYVSDLIRDQPSNAGGSDAEAYNLLSVYFFGILNFRYDDNDRYKNKLLVRTADLRDQNGERFSDLINITLIQLPLFDKAEDGLFTHREKWFYFIKNLPSLDHIPSVLNEPIFHKAFEEARYAALPLEEQRAYDRSVDQMISLKAAFAQRKNEGLEEGLATGRAEGLAEGLAIGLAQGEEIGRDKERLKIAADMKMEGVPIGTISKITGFPISEIENLQQT